MALKNSALLPAELVNLAFDTTVSSGRGGVDRENRQVSCNLIFVYLVPYTAGILLYSTLVFNMMFMFIFMLGPRHPSHFASPSNCTRIRLPSSTRSVGRGW